MNKTNLIFATAVLATFGALSGCGIGQASVADQDEIRDATPVPVEVTTPFRSDVYATYHATATISSDFDAPVAARVGGEIVELVVEEGEFVEKGQLLARLDGDRLRLEMLSARANLEQARKEYKRNMDLAERGLISASMYEGLKYDLDALQANFELRQLNYDYSGIRAPIAGVVSSRDVKLGQNLGVNDVAFRITDTAVLQAHLQIPQSELYKFEAGHTATVEVASMPGSEFPAIIERISPTIDIRNGTFRATARIDNESGDLAPGMFARFTIAYEVHENALVVPAAAVIEEDEQATVYVVADGMVSLREVDVGIQSGGVVEILSGLADDETVVVVGHTGLRDGSKVLASATRIDSYTG